VATGLNKHYCNHLTFLSVQFYLWLTNGKQKNVMQLYQDVKEMASSQSQLCSCFFVIVVFSVAVFK